MLLATVIIVLREVLEAMLLMSLFLGISYRLLIPRTWMPKAVLLGLLCAYGYATFFQHIASAFDGVGQEVFNANLQILTFACLLLFNVIIITLTPAHIPQSLLTGVMQTGVSLVICQEGAEIMLYLTGYAARPEQYLPLVIGTVFGAGIGLSLGILLYYFMSSLPVRMTRILGYSILLLVGASLVSQAVRLLIQIDWLPGGPPLWDTSTWIAEGSVTGQLLYALVGYEATPTALEGLFYLAALLLVPLCSVLVKIYQTVRRSEQ